MIVRDDGPVVFMKNNSHDQRLFRRQPNLSPEYLCDFCSAWHYYEGNGTQDIRVPTQVDWQRQWNLQVYDRSIWRNLLMAAMPAGMAELMQETQT